MTTKLDLAFEIGTHYMHIRNISNVLQAKFQDSDNKDVKEILEYVETQTLGYAPWCDSLIDSLDSL